MKCNEIKEFLADYLDNELSPDNREIISAHLDMCVECREEYARVKNYKEALMSMGKVKAPGDFLESLHKRIDEQTVFRKLIEKIFLPLKIKLPLEAAGLVAVSVLAFFYLNPGNTFKDEVIPTDRAVFEEREMKESPSKTRISQKRSFDMAVQNGKSAYKPAVKKEDSLKGMMKKINKEEKIVTYEVALLIKPSVSPGMLEDEADDSFLGGAGEKEVKNKDIEPNMQSMKSESRRRSMPREEKKEKKIIYNGPVERIKQIAGKLEGRVTEQDIDKKTNAPKSVTVVLPEKNYDAFILKLKDVGKIRNNSAPIMRRAEKKANIRIDFQK